MELSSDMINKAQWAANLMAEDGITAEDMKDEEFSKAAIHAYMLEIGRKIEKIQTTYMTNQLARQAFQGQICADMTDTAGNS